MILGDFEWDNLTKLDDQAYGSHESNTDDDDEESASDDQEVNEEEVNSETTVWMPSTFGHDVCIRNGWQDIAKQEVQLRIAQADDSLEELRLAIGHKTLLYKTHIRNSKTQSSKTRSRAELLQINQKIQEWAWRYRRARAALLNLSAPTEILNRFQVLLDVDLKVNTDVVEESRVGQRNDTISWFWRIGGGDDLKSNPWINECKWVLCLGPPQLTSMHQCGE
jgi:hypothetical protein